MDFNRSEEPVTNSQLLEHLRRTVRELCGEVPFGVPMVDVEISSRTGTKSVVQMSELNDTLVAESFTVAQGEEPSRK